MSGRRTGQLAWRLANGAAMAVAICVIVAVAATAAGLAAGYRPVVITGGSMGASVPDGSLVVARPVADLAVGDILVMRRSGRATVTHRIIDLESAAPDGPRFAITRGDANPQADPAPYPLGRRELVARWILPHLGSVVLKLAAPVYGMAIVSTVVVLLVTIALRRIWRPTSPPAERQNHDGPDRTGPGRADPGTPAPGDPAPSPARRRVVTTRLGVVALAGGLAGLVAVAWAFYLDSAPVAGNQFTTPACYQARVASVQKGSHLSTAAGANTVTIDPVDPDRSFLVFSARSSGADPDDAMVLGRLVTATTLAFVRTSDTPTPPAITVEWAVVSYSCGVTVQRGTVSADGSALHDVAVNPVDPAASFALGSWVPPSGATDHDGDDLVSYGLTSATNLRIATDASGIAPGTQLGWQVITFDNPADASVQQVTGTLGPGSGTATVTLPAPVNPATTLLVAGPRSAATGPEIGERSVRVRLLDPTTVEIHRSVTSEQVRVDIQVVDLHEGSLVTHGIVTLDPSASTATVGIPPVDVDRSTALSTVQSPGSMSGGATDHTVGDVPGEAAATMVLTSPTAVAIERSSTASTATFAWQVVTWGGPDWADANWAFRQRIDVTAGAVDAPNGYTTSVVVDHQALVASGLARADGDDVRLWYHDGTTWTELDRVVDPASSWNSGTTTLWFRTEGAVSAGRSASYWLYYGNPAASPAPADPDQVWLLREGFESGLGAFEDRTGGTGWYSADPWSRRIVLTVDANAVDAPLTDQPVLVRLTSADLAAEAQPDGSDIRFTGADGSTALPHEIESYNAGTGTLTAWVLVPALSDTSDTTLHLYYGATDAPAQADPRAVWPDELAVWHLARDRAGPAPSLDDASPNQLDGLALGDTALVDSPSGPAAYLDGAVDRLEASPRDLPDGPLSMAAWFQADAVSGEAVLVGQGDPTGSGVFELAVVSGAARLRLNLTGGMLELTGGTVVAGQWHHLAATWNGTTAALYLDGLPVATTTGSGTTPDGSAIAFTLGGDSAGSRTLDGRLGEVALGRSAWSPAELRFRERNLRDPAGTVTPAAPTGGSWFPSGSWAQRRPLTVDADLVAGTLTDYPLLVQLVDAQLAAMARSDGHDLVFTAADGVTRLDHHLESWDGVTGALTAWVRLPTVSDSADTHLFLYVGNPAAPNQEDREAVWGPDADLVLTG